MEFNIGEYLKKFTKITPPDDFLKEIILEGVKTEIGIDIDKKNITVSGGIVYIKTSPIIKNEIFMKKEKIISIIKEKQTIKIADIR